MVFPVCWARLWGNGGPLLLGCDGEIQGGCWGGALGSTFLTLAGSSFLVRPGGAKNRVRRAGSCSVKSLHLELGISGDTCAHVRGARRSLVKDGLRLPAEQLWSRPHAD